MMSPEVLRAMINLGHGWRVLQGTIGGTIKVLRRDWTPYDGMELLLREFYAALQENRPVPVSAQDGVRVMEVMDAAWQQIGSQAQSET